MVSLKLLIVEDDPDIIEVLSELLETEGFEISRARNGREAFEILKDGPLPCLIFLDLMMPVMNGSEFLQLKNASSEFSHIPVVLMSAAFDGTPLDGVQQYLSKPLDVDRILEVAHHCLST